MALFAAVRAKKFFEDTEKRIEELEKKHNETVLLCCHEGHMTLRSGVFRDWPGCASNGPLSVFNWSTEKWS